MRLINLTITITILFLFISCEKSQDLTPNPTFSGNSNFTVDIDGVFFEAVTMSANMAGGRTSIVATNANGEQVTILLDGTTAKTYPVNSSGSNLLQFLRDPNNQNELYSSFYRSSPSGSISVTNIDQSELTISGSFNGLIGQLSFIGTGDSLTMTNGTFNNIPYTQTTNTFNFGSFEFDADGQKVEMNTATVSILDGNFNGSTYEYYNISSATSNFAKSILIELDDSRYQEGITTYFTDSYSGPFSSQNTDSLAYASYSTGMSGGNPTFYDSQSGSVTVNKIETVNGQERVSGVFNFSGKANNGSSVSITNGIFSGIIR